MEQLTQDYRVLIESQRAKACIRCGSRTLYRLAHLEQVGDSSAYLVRSEHQRAACLQCAAEWTLPQVGPKQMPS